MARATVHGAISIVNAIATGNGSALGISLKVVAEASMADGQGIVLQSNKNDRLIHNIIYNTIPAKIIQKNQISVKIESEIPVGFGLKSSSAVSSAVALACTGLLSGDIDDYLVLDAATKASLDAKVTITGAYDDSTACYFGGFVLTDNYAQRLIRREQAPDNIYSVIFLPQNLSRGNPHNLKMMSEFFSDAFKLAEARNYWQAMKLNGILTSAALGGSYGPVVAAFEKGALSASTSGNGPAIASVCYEEKIDEIKSVMNNFKGRILISRINNQKASVEKIDG
jgi:shikimate kinase